MIAVLAGPSAAGAEPLVSAYFNNRDGFTIMGSSLNRVSGMEIRIDYQSFDAMPATVNPLLDRRTAPLTVTLRGGDSVTLVLASTKPLSGNLQLATVRIAGSINMLTAVIRHENGSIESPRIAITNPPREKLDELAARGATAERTPPPAPGSTSVADAGAADTKMEKPAPSAAPISGADRQRKREVLPVEAAVAPPPGAQGTSVDQLVHGERQVHPTFSRQRSLLERFLAQTGGQSAAGLASLLQDAEAQVVQSPPLGLADGAAPIRLAFPPFGGSGRSPQFFISGGHCNGLTLGADGAWVLEVLPDRGRLNVSVTVLQGNELVEYPLAIVPPLELFDSTTADTAHVRFVHAAHEVLRTCTKPR